MLIISPQSPIWKYENINSAAHLAIVPIRVEYIDSLALPIAWSDAERGDWIYCNKQNGASIFK